METSASNMVILGVRNMGRSRKATSGNAISGNAISGNAISGNATSRNATSRNATSGITPWGSGVGASDGAPW